MDSFSLVQPKCSLHSKPLSLICVNPSCEGNSTSCSVQFCYDCPSSKHQLVTLQVFSRNFCLLLNDRSLKSPQLKEDVDALKYVTKVKSSIETEHLRLIENIMKCISDDKKSLFTEVDVSTKMANDEREKIKKALSRAQHFTHMFHYYSRPQLLDLKMQLSTSKALVDFRDRFFEMDKLSNEDCQGIKKLQKLKENIIKNGKNKMLDSVTQKFKEILKLRTSGQAKPKVLMERKNSLQVGQIKRPALFDRKNSDVRTPSSRK